MRLNSKLFSNFCIRKTNYIYENSNSVKYSRLMLKTLEREKTKAANACICQDFFNRMKNYNHGYM